MSDYGNEPETYPWEYDGPRYVGKEGDEPELVDEEWADDEGK